MKKLTFCLSCFLLMCQLAYNQQFTHVFGKSSNEEFTLTKYAKDTTAEAVYIYNIGESTFSRAENDFEIYFEHRFKIKVLSSAGIKFSEFDIPFYRSDKGVEEILEIEGFTYNFEDGKLNRTALNPKQFYDEKVTKEWTKRKFAMPNVKVGSVIEVRYLLRTPYKFNLRSWYFQQPIPVIYSDYTAQMIPFYEYAYIVQGIKKFDESKSYESKGFKSSFGGLQYHDMVYNFVMKDMPAFRDVDFLTSSDDYIAKIDFQMAAVHQLNGTVQKIMTTWPDAITDLYDNEYFGKFFKAAAKSGKSVTDTMGLSLLSPTERTIAISNYVKNNFTWNGEESKFTDQSFKQFFKSKKGNSAEINLYLVGLLNSAGIKAYPLLLSTRDNGKVKSEYPFSKFFNYVIAEIELDDKVELIDATEPFCAFGEIPTRCINDKGLIANMSKAEWLTYTPPTISMVSDSFSLNLTQALDSINIIGEIAATGYHAIDARKKSFKTNADLRKYLNINHLNFSDSLIYKNQNNNELPFIVGVKASSALEVVENKLVIDPFCGVQLSENLFKQPTRQYPVDITYRKGKSFVSVIHIPENYTLLAVPKNIKISNAMLDLIYRTEYLDKNTLKVTSSYTMKKDVYESDFYYSLKGLFSIIVEKMNEKIVLEKNK